MESSNEVPGWVLISYREADADLGTIANRLEHTCYDREDCVLTQVLKKHRMIE